MVLASQTLCGRIIWIVASQQGPKKGERGREMGSKEKKILNVLIR